MHKKPPVYFLVLVFTIDEKVYGRFRAGKVSVESASQAYLRDGDEMRARPRPSGCAARGHTVQWTVVLDGPKRSEDRAGTSDKICSVSIRHLEVYRLQ